LDNANKLTYQNAFFKEDPYGTEAIGISNPAVTPPSESTRGPDFSFSGHEYNLMWVNDSGRFFETQFSFGLCNDLDSRSVVAADLDQDGDLDLVLRTNRKSRPQIYENTLSSGSKYVSVNLRQPGKNHWAVGARVIVDCGGHKQIALVRAGDSFMAQSPYTLFFGVGECNQEASATVSWPDRSIEKFQNLALNSTSTLMKGTAR
jgi:hypothetical protein